MNKQEYIKYYGEEGWRNLLEKQKEYYKQNKERKKRYSNEYRKVHVEKYKGYKKHWALRNPDKIKQTRNNQCRKTGLFYERNLIKEHTGLRGARNKIRSKHANVWRKYKGNWLIETQIHHEWIEGTAGYRGIAIVDKMEHQYGIINPIKILEGEITLLCDGF